MHALLLALLTVVGLANPQAGPAGPANPFVGHWTSVNVMVDFVVVGDAVTITEGFVGQVGSGRQTFQTDGKEHDELMPGVVARWRGARILEIVVMKKIKLNGQVERVTYEVVTYEVSPDGKTLTVSRSGVFDSLREVEANDVRGAGIVYHRK